MAKIPLANAAGAHPLSDLLFSPRAAFIWNHTRKSVAWMNPAARAAFALRLEDFSASLPPGLIRRFAQFAERKEGGTAKVKIFGGPSLSCSIEILKLADGQDGLIVAEIGEAEAHPAPRPLSKSRKTAAQPDKTRRKAPARPATQSRKAPNAPPALTAEEMRAFKAVGRKVLRLCEDKKPSKEAPAAVIPPILSNVALSPDRSAQAFMDVLAAFDLVLYLDDGLGIVRLQGRAARLGWRKASLTGKSVEDLVLRRDRAVLRRMVKKLYGQASQSSKSTLVFQGESGNAIPCRAILGRWGDDGAAFFLALLSLELPARLKGLQPEGAVASPRRAA